MGPGGDPGPPLSLEGVGARAGSEKQKLKEGKDPHPVFRTPAKARDGSLIIQGHYPTDAPGKMVAFQKPTTSGCGNGNVHSAEAFQVSGHGIGVAQLHPLTSNDQRPGHHALDRTPRHPGDSLCDERFKRTDIQTMQAGQILRLISTKGKQHTFRRFRLYDHKV